jgi:predicted Na+-dependent transporter
MPIDGPIPGWLLSLVAVTTIFAVMFDLGLAIAPGDFRRAWVRPGPLLKSLFAVLVAVPALALLVVRAVDLARPVEVGIVLMAIAPGAPVALRRSLDAGGERGFAPALQIAVAILAVGAIPLWIAGLDELYAASASVDPRHLARQVFIAQLLPLGLGIALTRLRPDWSAALAARTARLTTYLLVALFALALVDVWQPVQDAGLHAAGAIALITAGGLACGHLLGGPEPGTRTAAAILTAARNPGLAMVVATVNHAPPLVIATILAYLLVSGLAVLFYVAWRRRTTTR